MTIPFYKIQVAGTGFVLVDLEQIVALQEADRDVREEEGVTLTPDLYGDAARALCDRNFGVGASGAIFLAADNTVRPFSAAGAPLRYADDALLCAARYAFDTGRVTNRSIAFETPYGQRRVDVLGAHEFRLNVGSPFSTLGGRVITAETTGIVESIEREGARAAYAAIHVHDDIVVAFPEGIETLNFSGFAALVQRAFPGKAATPVVARCVTHDAILARIPSRRDVNACAVAAASLVAAVSMGMSGFDAVVMFERSAPDDAPSNLIAKDRDNSRRLAASWDRGENDLYVTGTGGYVFEGKFDFAPSATRDR